jgi:cell division protein ZapA
MTQAKTGTKVEIFGTEYRIKGEANAEYIRRVAAYVDGKMQQLAQASSTASVSKLAILTAINIADELFREREDREKTLAALAERLKLVDD